MVILPGCVCCGACGWPRGEPPESVEVAISSANSQYYTIGSSNSAYLPAHSGTYSLSVQESDDFLNGFAQGDFVFTSPDSLVIVFKSLPGASHSSVPYYDFTLQVWRSLRVSNMPVAASSPLESDMAASDWRSRLLANGSHENSGFNLQPRVVSLVDSCLISSPSNYRWALFNNFRGVGGASLYNRDHFREQSAAYTSCHLPVGISYRHWLTEIYYNNGVGASSFPFSKTDSVSFGEHDPSAPEDDYVGYDGGFTIDSVSLIYPAETVEMWGDINQATCTPL